MKNIAAAFATIVINLFFYLLIDITGGSEHRLIITLLSVIMYLILRIDD